jgi:ligand-binding SRPBCC domain-containing protein
MANKLHRIHTEQKLPITVEEAWDFLTDPGNLAKITPPDMGFEIVYGNERKMFPGQLIEYRVSPFKGVKTKWVTEITQVKKPEMFVDIQLYGPYDLWHHKHFIHPIPDGVIMEDEVHYRLPLGALGNLVHPWLVKPKLEKIFSFRESALTKIFGTYQQQENQQTLKQDVLA